MPKRIIILLNIALLFQCANAIGKDPVQNDKVKGGFRECQVYSFSYKSGEIDTSSKKISKYMKYDSNGNLNEYIIFSSDSSCKKCTYKYNNKGKLIECDNYRGNDSLYSNIRYEYDENDKIIGKTYYNIEDSTISKGIFKYDEFGNANKEIYYNKNDLTSNMFSYKYDVNGNIVEELEYKSEPFFSYFFKNIYKYDVNGNRIESILFDNRDSLILRSSFKFDEWGNKIDELSYNSTINQVYCYKYIYSK